MILTRTTIVLSIALTITIVLGGCTHPEFNPAPIASEDEAITDVMQLTFNFAKAGEAYFSPDMKWIIFQAAPKGEEQYQMYVAPLMYDVVEKNPPLGSVVRATPMEGTKIPVRNDIIRLGDPIRISPEKSRNTCGYFSPDGESILFASTAGKDDPNERPPGYQGPNKNYGWSYPAGMELYRADGWKSAIAAAEPGSIVDLAKHPLTSNEVYDAECAYSPDGKWIVFTRKKTPAIDDKELDLFAMRSDGSDVAQLTHAPGYDGGAFFSPDGKQLVYRSDRKGNDLLQIFVADIVRDGEGDVVALKNERQLTHDANVNWGPFWHPDGKHIIYATSLHGHANYELYLVRADGTLKTRITKKDGPDLLPSFSPDGKYLMWTSRRSRDGSPQVMIAKFKLPKGS